LVKRLRNITCIVLAFNHNKSGRYAMGITQAEKETCLCTIIKDYVNPFPSVINLMLNGWIT